METIRGARADHLSPVTRRMNTMAKATIKHLAAHEAAAKLKADLRTSLLMRMQLKLNAESGEKPKDLLRKDQVTIKQFKNELKQIVTTDAEKYHPLSSGNPNFTFIDVLPDSKPVYIKMPCGSLWSPCTIELMLGDVEQLQVLLSTVDKFPALQDHKYEREKQFIKERKEKVKGEKEANPRMSVDEAATARSTVGSAPGGQGLGAQELRNTINEKKFTFGFMKTGEYHSTQFEDHEVIYMTLLSQSGGTVRMRAEFNQNKEKPHTIMNSSA